MDTDPTHTTEGPPPELPVETRLWLATTQLAAAITAGCTCHELRISFKVCPGTASHPAHWFVETGHEAACEVPMVAARRLN